MKAGKTAGVVLLILLFCLGFLVAPVCADDLSTTQPTTVTCYLGDPSENELVGTIDIAYPAMATSTCNTVFIDCKGRCTGCFIDRDAGEVCR